MGQVANLGVSRGRLNYPPCPRAVPECLDHLFVVHEKQLHRVLHAYLLYFNQARPHQGIKQKIPEQRVGSVSPHHASGKVVSFPVLGGLHRDYRRSA
jgi:putative transposase